MRDIIWEPCLDCGERYRLLEKVLLEWAGDLAKYEVRIGKDMTILENEIIRLEALVPKHRRSRKWRQYNSCTQRAFATQQETENSTSM
jgi:hypothetical protein